MRLLDLCGYAVPGLRRFWGLARLWRDGTGRPGFTRVQDGARESPPGWEAGEGRATFGGEEKAPVQASRGRLLLGTEMG